MKWFIEAYACNPVRASDGSLLDYEEVDLDREIEADTAKQAVEDFHEWLHDSGEEITGELFIKAVRRVA